MVNITYAISPETSEDNLLKRSLINSRVFSLNSWKKTIILLRRKNRRRRLTNESFTLVANNCVAGAVYQDLSLEYLTPFVGLYMNPNDFVRLCSSFEHYMGMDLVEKKQSEFPFPVGQIEEITIYFMHYQSYDEALSKWNSRKKRMNFSRLGFILVQRDGCTEEDMQEFDSLEVTNKIILTTSVYPNLKTSIFLRHFKGEAEVGNVLEFKKTFPEDRIMWDFNFVRWINNFL